MPDKTYKMIELVGVSEDSIQQAVRNAITRASQRLKGLDWFEVTAVRGLVKDGQVSQFQVKLKVGFRVLNEEEMRGAGGTGVRADARAGRERGPPPGGSHSPHAGDHQPVPRRDDRMRRIPQVRESPAGGRLQDPRRPQQAAEPVAGRARPWCRR